VSAVQKKRRYYVSNSVEHIISGCRQSADFLAYAGLYYQLQCKGLIISTRLSDNFMK